MKKFKIWDNNKKRFVIEPLNEIMRIDHNGYCIEESDARTIVRSTGEKDRNGAEVYEGDILKTEKSSPVGFCAGIVRFGLFKTLWGDKNLGFYFDDIMENRPLLKASSNIVEWIQDYNATVIGNIFETPDLIEKLKTERDS